MSDLLLHRMILNVRDWLKNGCDPAYAALELEAIAARIQADQPSDARAEVWRKAHQDHCTMGSGCPYRDEAWVESLVRAADQQDVQYCECKWPVPREPAGSSLPWCNTCGFDIQPDKT
jgi:hypothetical protein